MGFPVKKLISIKLENSFQNVSVVWTGGCWSCCLYIHVHAHRRSYSLEAAAYLSYNITKHIIAVCVGQQNSGDCVYSNYLTLHQK